MKLALQALQTFAIGVIVLGLLLFLPAWTLNYWQAWVFIIVFNISVNGIGLYLAIKDPELLERRKKFGPATEQSPAQKVIMSVAIFSILGLFVFCALDHRFGWSPVPAWVSLIGDGLFWRRAVDPQFDANKVLPVLVRMVSTLLNPVTSEGIGAATAPATKKTEATS